MGVADTAASDVSSASQSRRGEDSRGSPHSRESDAAVKKMPEGSWDPLWQVGAHFEAKTFVLAFCLSVSLQSN